MTARINGGLGARIKEAYLAAGLNQTKLAERLGTTPSIVNGWIKQEVVPEGRFLMLMPEILQCDANCSCEGRSFRGPRRRASITWWGA